MESCVGNLKKQLQCSLCKDTLIDPKLVDCFHVFCKLCIKRTAEVVDQQDYIFKCPQCDSKTLLQDLNDVEDLQTSPVHSRILKALEFVENQKVCSVSSSHHEALWQCLDCDRSLCEECVTNHAEFIKDHQVVSLSDLKKKDIDKLLKREPPCTRHEEQSVEFYCEDCKMLICSLCMREHHNHKIITLQDIIDVEKDSLAKTLKKINEMSANEEEKEQQQEIALALKRDGEKAKQQVKELAKKLIETINNNEYQLLNEIQKSITKAQKNLRIISHTAQAQEYIKYFMTNSTASEKIDIRHDKSSQNFTYEPFDKIVFGIDFKPDEELCKQMNHDMGMVRVLKKADPALSSVEVVSSGNQIEASKKVKLELDLKTAEDEVAQEHRDNLDIQVTPEDNVKVGEIQMTQDGRTAVDLIPRVPGRLTADVKLHGNPVCNSPWVMYVRSQEIQFMTQNSKLKDALNTGSKKFTGIAVNKTNSRIAVADKEEHRIRVYNMDRDLLLRYGSQGNGQRQLNYPEGLAFLNESDLVIVDTGNNRICILDTTAGQNVTTFRCGSGPSGVHVDCDSHIMVCFQSSNRVQVFTKDGVYLYHFSAPNPRDITIHNGLFYVSDLNAAVHVMEKKEDQSFTTITTISRPEWANGKLSLQGLAIDNDDNLLICANAYFNPVVATGYIYKFTLDGRYVGCSVKLSNELRYIVALNNGQVICTTCGEGVVFLDN